MAHDAERGCSEDEPDSLLGDRGPLPPLGPVGRFRWVCGASAALPAGPLDGTAPGRPGMEPMAAGSPDGLDDPRSAGDPADPSGASRPSSARTAARPAGAAATGDQAGTGRPMDSGTGRPMDSGEGAALASGPGDAEHAVTDPGRLGDRSRLVPRPRPGEPDGEVQGRQAGAATSPGAPEPPSDPAGRRTPGCQTDLPGWAGAHRHGAVRPSRRSVRRDRPPRRWC